MRPPRPLTLADLKAMPTDRLIRMVEGRLEGLFQDHNPYRDEYPRIGIRDFAPVAELVTRLAKRHFEEP